MKTMELLESFLPSINLVLILTCSIICFCSYFSYKYNYWNRRHVPNISPSKYSSLAFQLMLHRIQTVEFFDKQYKDFEGHKYGGVYQNTRPCLILRDPGLIKTCLVNSFSNFHDHAAKPDEKTDQFAESLFQLTGEKWHQVRTKLSPAFSSNKLKIMYETLKECAQELNTYLQKLCSEAGETEIDVKELMSNYTMDVIGACAMGIKCNAIQDPNCEIKKIVNLLFEFDFRRLAYTWLEIIHPKLPRIFGLKLVRPEVVEFLTSVVKEAVEIKKEDASSTRKDFLQILMNLRRSEVKHDEFTEESVQEIKPSEGSEGPIFTESGMVSIISTFLSAGVDPVSATLAFCLYELAAFPDVQDKLFKEIQTVKKEVGYDISYEDLKKFKYIEQVVNETLRKYPVGSILIRNCTKPFTIPDSSVVVEKDVKIFIPMYSLHHDPKYFPEPDKFDPDRFSEKNIDKIVPGSYLPFGDGPRFCIANRLALMDVKTMLITMISNYQVHTCAKTPKCLEFDKTRFTLSPEGELWLRLQKRK